MLLSPMIAMFFPLHISHFNSSLCLVCFLDTFLSLFLNPSLYLLFHLGSAFDLTKFDLFLFYCCCQANSLILIIIIVYSICFLWVNKLLNIFRRHYVLQPPSLSLWTQHEWKPFNVLIWFSSMIYVRPLIYN